MASPFAAYPAPLHCGIYRANIKALPECLTSIESELSQLRPPFELIAVHNTSHLISFARHIKLQLDEPVKKVASDQGNYYSVLGVALFHKLPNNTLALADWIFKSESQQPTPRWIVPEQTPVFDFPRTTLWHDKLSAALAIEAAQRIPDPSLAQAWADWAWQAIRTRLIDPVDMRRLRSKIRYGLELDAATLTMLRRIRAITGEPMPNVPRYNFVQQRLRALTELWQLSPLMAVLACDLNLDEGWDKTPAKFIKRACIERGIKPRQWKLMSEPKAPLLSAYKSFRREFAGTSGCEAAADFLSLISVLTPTKGFEINLWRSILSMTGTRSKAPESYAFALVRVRVPINHMLRMIERGACPANPDELLEQVHQICAWITDKGIKSIDKSKRRLGWTYLHLKGLQHAINRERRLAYGEDWQVPIEPVTIKGYHLYPISNGAELWEEAVAMSHCADLYSEQCQRGDMVMFSVRRGDLKRYATMALCKQSEVWRLMQVSGKANKRLGSDLDIVGNVLAMLLNVNSASQKQNIDRPHYRIKVMQNAEPDNYRIDRICYSRQEATEAAKSICLAKLVDQNCFGQLYWELYGETPTIEAKSGAPEVEFNASMFIANTCNIQLNSFQKENHD